MNSTKEVIAVSRDNFPEGLCLQVLKCENGSHRVGYLQLWRIKSLTSIDGNRVSVLYHSGNSIDVIEPIRSLQKRIVDAEGFEGIFR